MTMDTWIGIVGAVFGILSFGYAVFVEHNATRLKRYQTKQLRLNIKNCIVVMKQSHCLVLDYRKFTAVNLEVVSRNAAIHAIAASLVKSLFSELSQVDTPYNDKKLKEYVSAGIITSKWIWEQAAACIISGIPLQMPDLPEHTKDWMFRTVPGESLEPSVPAREQLPVVELTGNTNDKV